MRKTLAAVIAAATLAIGATVTVSLTDRPVKTTLPACAQEDGSGGPIPCYWDASTQGNGRGESVVVTR